MEQKKICKHHFSSLEQSVTWHLSHKISHLFFNSPRLADRSVRTLNTFFVPVLSPVLYGGFRNTNIDIETFSNPNYIWICLICLVISPIYIFIIFKTYS